MAIMFVQKRSALNGFCTRRSSEMGRIFINLPRTTKDCHYFFVTAVEKVGNRHHYASFFRLVRRVQNMKAVALAPYGQSSVVIRQISMKLPCAVLRKISSEVYI